MKAKKYDEGGKFPPKVREMKKKAAKKKAAKNAPLKGGMLAETTVTAKAPKPNEKIKREVNKPVGSNFTFIGDPGGVGKLAKVAKSMTASKAYRGAAKVAEKMGKPGTASLRRLQGRAHDFDALESVSKTKQSKLTNKLYNKLAEKTQRGGVNPRAKGFSGAKRSDKDIAKDFGKKFKSQDAAAKKFNEFNYGTSNPLKVAAKKMKAKKK